MRSHRSNRDLFRLTLHFLPHPHPQSHPQPQTQSQSHPHSQTKQMSLFHFKEFSIQQDVSAMKVGTDAMILGSLVDANLKVNGLDIGTGTGVLSLMLAQKNKNICIHAIEIDVESAKEAELNFQNSSWSNRLRIVHADFRTFFPEIQFDLIISNPPYFENGILNESVRKANSRHEDSLPLQELFQKVAEMLAPNGHFWLILPFETAAKWKMKANEMKFFCEKEIIIFGKPNLPKRMVFCFSKVGVECEKSSVLIRTENNEYSNEYKELTVDFHGVKL